MPKGKTGRPRGRPVRPSDPLRLQKDAAAAALSAILTRTDTDAARIANKIVAGDARTWASLIKNRYLMLSLQAPPRQSEESDTRYTQKILAGTADIVMGRSRAQAEWVAASATELFYLLAAPHRKIAEAHAYGLINAGWTVNVIGRFMELAAVMHWKDGDYFDMGSAANKGARWLAALHRSGR
ncbi:MAG: hypothetical protein ACM33T_06350 [Solirubrobacterales bacterium]